MQRHAPARGAADVSCTLPRRPDFADLSPFEAGTRATAARLARQARGHGAADAARRGCGGARAHPGGAARRLRHQCRAAPREVGAQESARACGGHRRGASGESAPRARRGGRRRIHQLPPDRRGLRARAREPPRAGRRLRREPARAGGAGAGGVRVSEPDRAAARGSRPAGRLRGHAREHPRRGGL